MDDQRPWMHRACWDESIFLPICFLWTADEDKTCGWKLDQFEKKITNLTIDWRQFKGQQESVSFSLPWTKSLSLFFLPGKPRDLPFLPLPWPAIFSQFTTAAKGKSEEGEKRREKEEKTRKGEGCTNPRPLGGSRGDSFDLIPLIWMRSRVCNDPFTLD